ncbi:hypothetical protein [Sediminibacterium sp. C3]|uniref:hypothetical protein n=1 Tax=Sediminibacterium sp. C3 TaxID=1267211 RepID=UPI0012679D98|nr:hypothetical protein [Sediminibacterium sp. C3]
MIQAGDMNIVQAIAELELRLGTLERVYDFLLNNNYSLTKPTQSDINKFRDAAFSDLQKKYPSLGLTKNS